MDLDRDEVQGYEFIENQDERRKALSLREKNEITAQLIKKQIGDIEQVRALMGLNKRRMCELLLIDPSTWTRWTTGKTPPPTWVYRALQWGLAVMDKHPEFHPLITKQGSEEAASKDSLNKKKIDELYLQMSNIKKELKKWTIIATGSFFISILLFVYILI